MRLRPSPGDKRIFMSLKPRERVWWLQMWLFPIVELTALPKSLSWISGDICGWKKGERERKEGKGKARKITKGTGQNTPK